MKFNLLLLFCFISTNCLAQFDTSGPLNKKVLNTVVEVKKGKSTGSGFLVSLGNKKLLVTNKHMVGAWSPVDTLICSDSIYLNLYSSKGLEDSYINVGIKISNAGIPLFSKLKLHPNSKVDIAVLDISDDIRNLSIGNTNFIDTSFLLPLAVANNFLTYGSQVFTIGYPAGTKAFKTNLPLVKSGSLASSLDGKLIMEQNWTNRKGQSVKTLTGGKIFIVDGLIIPGNSGGPVVMSQEIVWFNINGQLKHLQDTKNYFIGIVSSIYTNAGLATIFSSDNILELVRKFN